MTAAATVDAGARAPTPATLVSGGSAGQREAAIAAALRPGVATAIILEGLSDGGGALAFDEGDARAAGVNVIRIAPGCLCCAGNLVLKVTLNRLLRRPPAQLYLSLADASHVDQLRAWLADAPYDALLALQSPLVV